MEDAKLTRNVLFGNLVDSMTDKQRNQYERMNNIDHLVNSAIADKRIPSNGECVTMQYAEFVESLYDAYAKMIGAMDSHCLDRDGENRCPIALFDGLIRIAEFAYFAIKNIVNCPSRTLTKVDVKMPASKTTNFGTKTMRWLSVRPGRDIAEKISPENKVLTSKTVFTVDNKENRELMYLYKQLNSIVSSRLSMTSCERCDFNKQKECGRAEWMLDMKKLLSTYSRVKTGELGEVKREKQATQNNKLMCDLNYKIIWDAVGMLSKAEEDVEVKFSTLAERFAQLVYWLIVGRIMQDKKAFLRDCIGKVKDVQDDDNPNKKLVFFDECNGTPHLSDVIIFKDDNEQYQRSLQISLKGTFIEIKDMTARKSLYNLDIQKILEFNKEA